MYKTAYIGIGSNLGNSVEQVRLAIENIRKITVGVKAVSSLYTSPPWGFESSNDFVNAVIAIETEQDAEGLLNELLLIEQEMGRKRKKNAAYESRIIDLDLIDYNGAQINSGKLTIPHPLMHKRAFVLLPLKEIAPDWKHPTFHLSIDQYIKKIKKPETVKKIAL
ncbi:MAG: 2-amino-4-hydroxy-6-hydroxymethyldihydropteridine diphosphokinase [Crocinitomicaceae bacterium]